MIMRKFHPVLAAFCVIALAACSEEPIQEAKKPFSTDWRDVATADQNIPVEVRRDYDALLSCRADLAVIERKEIPGTSVESVAGLVNEVTKSPMVVAQCQESLSAARTKSG